MGGTKVPAPQPTGDVLKSYTDYLPGLIQATSAEMPTIAQNQLNATMATQPFYNALNLQQAQQYALPLAKVGQDVQLANTLAGGEAQLAQLRNTGLDTAALSQQVARAGSPEYYSVAGPAAQKAVDLLNATNLRGLSPGQQNAVERSLAQSQSATGNLGIDNATNAVANAMAFGDRYNQQAMLAGNLQGAANQTLGALSPSASGFNPVNIALGQPNVSTMGNFGTGTFTNVTPNTQSGAAGNAFGFGQSTLGNMSSMNNAFTSAAGQANAANISGMYGLGSSALSGAGSMAGGACCFIVMESYHGTMPSFVRKCRDRYYRTNPEIAEGYKRMAKWLVPLMRKSFIVRSAVWHFMVKPLTDYGSFIVNRTEKRGKWARKFWFTLWKLTSNI